MTFQDWWKDNAVELNEDYSKASMEWIAELAWNAAGTDMRDLIQKANNYLSGGGCGGSSVQQMAQLWEGMEGRGRI